MSESVVKNELPMFFGDSGDNEDKRINDSGDEKDNGDPEEDNDSDIEFIPPPPSNMGMPQQTSSSVRRAGGGNTGVKGVLADYAEFQENQRQEYLLKQEMNRRMLESMCVTINDKPQPPKEEDEEDEDLKRIREQRLAQFRAKSNPTTPKNKTFGFLKQISSKEYVEEIDNEPPNVFVIIHLYQNYVPECVLLNQQLAQLAVKYSHIKFLKILSTEAKPGYHDEALPTLLVYIGGKLLVSFIPITEELERNFVKEDLELLLASYDIIPNPSQVKRWEHSLSDKKSNVTNIHKTKNNYDDDEDDLSDEDY